MSPGDVINACTNSSVARGVRYRTILKKQRSMHSKKKMDITVMHYFNKKR